MNRYNQIMAEFDFILQILLANVQPAVPSPSFILKGENINEGNQNKCLSWTLQ